MNYVLLRARNGLIKRCCIIVLWPSLFFVFGQNNCIARICEAADGSLVAVSKIAEQKFSLALQACYDKKNITMDIKRSHAEIKGEFVENKNIDKLSVETETHQQPHFCKQNNLVDTQVKEFNTCQHELTNTSGYSLTSEQKLRRIARSISSRALDHDASIYLVAQQHDIDPLLLHAIAHVESRHDPNAISPAGALGLMQIMPNTASRFGVENPSHELFDPLINLNVSCTYLKLLQRLFGNDLSLVLAAYNAGEGAVIKYNRSIPPYQETQKYVSMVIDYYLNLKDLY